MLNPDPPTVEERVAQDTLKRYGWPARPLSPETIASALGAMVRDHAGPECGGFVVEDGRPTVAVNRACSVWQQRFAVAHALGHWLLGHAAPRWDTVANYALRAESVGERAANAVAGALLVPRNAVLDAVERGTTVDDLARQFGVVSSLVEMRLRTLGLISA